MHSLFYLAIIQQRRFACFPFPFLASKKEVNNLAVTWLIGGRAGNPIRRWRAIVKQVMNLKRERTSSGTGGVTRGGAGEATWSCKWNKVSPALPAFEAFTRPWAGQGRADEEGGGGLWLDYEALHVAEATVSPSLPAPLPNYAIYLLNAATRWQWHFLFRRHS